MAHKHTFTECILKFLLCGGLPPSLYFRKVIKPPLIIRKYCFTEGIFNVLFLYLVPTYFVVVIWNKNPFFQRSTIVAQLCSVSGRQPSNVIFNFQFSTFERLQYTRNIAIGKELGSRLRGSICYFRYYFFYVWYHVICGLRQWARDIGQGVTKDTLLRVGQNVVSKSHPNVDNRLRCSLCKTSKRVRWRDTLSELQNEWINIARKNTNCFLNWTSMMTWNPRRQFFKSFQRANTASDHHNSKNRPPKAAR